MSTADPSVEGPGSLVGRVAIVTGAARGQGRAIADRLLLLGASVVAGDVLEDVHAWAEEHADDRAIGASLDVTDQAAWETVVGSAFRRFGSVDILVNNAGVLHRQDLLDEDPATFERIHQVNCVGPFLGMKTAVPYMKQGNGGAIVNTVSTAALAGFPGHGAYSASKWALRGLSVVAALEFAGLGIRVNAIFPGPVLTPMIVRDDDPTVVERLSRTPLGRAGQPVDIAHLVSFLVSDAASFITGAEIVIDGGQVSGLTIPKPA